MMNSRVRSTPGTRARLVALLGLEVVQDLWQLAVGADLSRDVPGEVLLVRDRQHQVGSPAVLELEDLVDVVAATALPELRGLQHRHQHLPGADGVELLAHDLLDLAVGAPAGGQPGPHPRPQLPGQPGPHQQLVGDRLGIGRGLSGGGEEVAR